MISCVVGALLAHDLYAHVLGMASGCWPLGIHQNLSKLFDTLVQRTISGNTCDINLNWMKMCFFMCALTAAKRSILKACFDTSGNLRQTWKLYYLYILTLESSTAKLNRASFTMLTGWYSATAAIKELN